MVAVAPHRTRLGIWLDTHRSTRFESESRREIPLHGLARDAFARNHETDGLSICSVAGSQTALEAI